MIGEGFLGTMVLTTDKRSLRLLRKESFICCVFVLCSRIPFHFRFQKYIKSILRQITYINMLISIVDILS